MDPGRQLSPVEQREATHALRTGLALAGISVEQLRRGAAALDGAFTHSQVADVAAVLDRSRGCTAHEYDVLAQALNDHFVGHGGSHPVRYSDELDGDIGATGDIAT